MGHAVIIFYQSKVTATVQWRLLNNTSYKSSTLAFNLLQGKTDSKSILIRNLPVKNMN